MICIEEEIFERHFDLYDVEPEDYLNKWFRGRQVNDEHGVYSDTFSLKTCDGATAENLYRVAINPIALLVCPKMVWNPENTCYDFPTNDKGEQIYNMKAMVCSIDDSSYGIWSEGMLLKELEELKYDLMEWVNARETINGNAFLLKCQELGFDRETIDYN